MGIVRGVAQSERVAGAKYEPLPLELWADNGLSLCLPLDFLSDESTMRIKENGHRDGNFTAFASRESDLERVYDPWHVRGVL